MRVTAPPPPAAKAVRVIKHPGQVETTSRKRLSAYIPVTESGCWIYTGSWDKKGYGKFKIDGKSTGKAHRFFYERMVGQIPQGRMICHKCDTPACVNPSHLYVGTEADNTRDRIARNRSSHGASHSIAIKRGLASRGAA